MHPEDRVDARALFSGIAHDYDRPASLLSFFQYRRWHRALVDRLALTPAAHTLDVATGTGLIARDIQAKYGCSVVGVDLTPAMLARADIAASAADARNLPFGDARFDAVTFSYLLRYVDDPESTLIELARVLKSGGIVGSVEFGVPSSATLKVLWKVYVNRFLPIFARLLGRGWVTVGAFLGNSIIEWDRAWPIEKQLLAWSNAGIEPFLVRTMSFGAGIVIVGRKR